MDFVDRTYFVKPSQQGFPKIHFPLDIKHHGADSSNVIATTARHLEERDQTIAIADIPTNHSYNPEEGDATMASEKPDSLQVKSELQSQFPDVLCNKPSRTQMLHHIKETATSEPIKRSPYKIIRPKLDNLKEQNKIMLDEGIIDPSYFPWCSPHSNGSKA